MITIAPATSMFPCFVRFQQVPTDALPFIKHSRSRICLEGVHVCLAEVATFLVVEVS